MEKRLTQRVRACRPPRPALEPPPPRANRALSHASCSHDPRLAETVPSAQCVFLVDFEHSSASRVRLRARSSSTSTSAARPVTTRPGSRCAAALPASLPPKVRGILPPTTSPGPWHASPAIPPPFARAARVDHELNKSVAVPAWCARRGGSRCERAWKADAQHM